MDDVMLQVEAARIRRSYQTHYLMTVAAPEKAFFELTLTIDGPTDPLTWGQDNLRLGYQGESFAPIHATWTVVGEDIVYEAGAEFIRQYIFYYEIGRDTNFEAYSLLLPERQEFPLMKLVEAVDFTHPEATAAVRGEASVLDGGEDNLASGPFSVVGGGRDNQAGAGYATVSGGERNQAEVGHAVIGGGEANQAANYYSTVGGGFNNQALGRDSVVGGGSRNNAEGRQSTIGGGIQNQALHAASVVSGGENNTAAAVYATVGGGIRNLAQGTGAVVAGGSGNQALGEQAVVAGGLANQAGGNYATVSGGQGNAAWGDFSLAAGREARVSPEHPGAFVWADSSPIAFSSAQADEFALRASGGVRIVSAIDAAGTPLAGVSLAPGSGSWSSLSDQAAKDNFSSFDGGQVLTRLAQIPIQSWNYRGQDPAVRHLGPSAQDFYRAFGLGEDNQHISAVDADGVSLAAIQALYEQFQDQQVILEQQQVQLLALQQRQIWMSLVLGLGGLSLGLLLAGRRPMRKPAAQ